MWVFSPVFVHLAAVVVEVSALCSRLLPLFCWCLAFFSGVLPGCWALFVFSFFGQYFCLHFKAFQLGMAPAPVYIAFLRFMGGDNEAKNCSYSLEVGGNGRKMIWQEAPRGIWDSHRKVRDSFDGLIIQCSMALFFSGGDR
ncbi:hypothetical protein LWI28_002071 [Acer negundo]|uniref:Seven-in-absentia protein TRAF-like domain-containing protein n=1 Tax=Acer negundo TaxID=4023 RepID=A0AAD5NGT1_ACENE|nr:hypothetical protein LWI28_002071 [Acer negundo]